MMHLTIQERSTEKPEQVRAAGRTPAVFYGAKENAVSISVDAAVFKKMWRDAGETTIISLEGVGEPKEALIRDVSVHAVTGEPLHIDFYVLEKGKKIQISVPLEFVGIEDAEKSGGVVVKVMHEVEIEVEPRELPQHLTVDVSKLNTIGAQLTVGEIPVPPSATFITDASEVVVSVNEQKIIEEMPTTPPTEAEAAAAAPAESKDE
jgi:large subunit ribosomal protein L25